MPVALAFGCFGRGERKTESSEVDAPATATATVSARWGGDACQSLGVQASLAASQTLDRCAGMVEGRMRVYDGSELLKSKSTRWVRGNME
jgi:hypothetical protein